MQLLYNKLEYPKYKCQFCNATMWFEEKTSHCKIGQNPVFSMCCQQGKIRLEKVQQPPTPLSRLLKYTNDLVASNFKHKIRVYNGIFSFTSFGGRIDNKINQSKGPYTFRMSGQNYHRFGSLLPTDGNRPKFAQLYFYDTENEVQNRMSCINEDEEKLDESIVMELLSMLDSYNNICKAFRMAQDWCNINNSGEFNLRLIGERHPIARQYNRPNTPEIVALIIGDFGNNIGKRDIVINCKTRGLQRISELHLLYMALQYPLLFPYGEDGYHEKIPYHENAGKKKTKRGNLTMREYYCYKIQQRANEGLTLIQGGRLYHQYLVDAYTAVEEERLRWMRQNQENLHADLYQNVYDAVTKGDTHATTIGKRIVLPSTFTGGPRYMVQNYQDAMAICRAFGNPTLFITFTANQKWPEIEEMLSEIPGQPATDRPDVMSRLFKIKLSQLMTDIQTNNIFGRTRGGNLPTMLCIFLKKDCYVQLTSTLIKFTFMHTSIICASFFFSHLYHRISEKRDAPCTHFGVVG